MTARTLYVLSTSREAAERHAALDPDVWWETAEDAQGWLDRWDDREMALRFQVYAVTIRPPVSMAGAVARLAAVAAGFAGLFLAIGVGSLI